MAQKKQVIETQIKKNEDELQECKKHKHFLDILAIQAGVKKFTPKSMLMETENFMRDALLKSGGSLGRPKPGGIKGETFNMTALGQSPQKLQNRKMLGPNKDLSDNQSKLSQGTREMGGMSRKQSRTSTGLRDGLSDDESKVQEPGLDHPYEDDDLTIYFDKKSLLEQIVKLEDDNLRKIELVQDDEIALDQ